MFEQALMPTTRNKPWTLGASVALQSAIVGTMVLYSALHVDLLPLNATRHLELPAPRVPKLDAIEIIGSFLERRAGSLTMNPRPFVSPVRIPAGISVIDDAGSDAPIYTPGPATTGTGTVFDGMTVGLGQTSGRIRSRRVPLGRIRHGQSARRRVRPASGGTIRSGAVRGQLRRGGVLRRAARRIRQRGRRPGRSVAGASAKSIPLHHSPDVLRAARQYGNRHGRRLRNSGQL